MQKHYSGQFSGPVPCSGEPLPGSFADPGAISPASVKRYAVAGMAGSHYDGLVSVSRATRTVLLTQFLAGSRTEWSRQMAAMTASFHVECPWLSLLRLCCTVGSDPWRWVKQCNLPGMMSIRLHLKIAGPVEQTLCPGVKRSQVRMERTTAHSDLHKRSSQAAQGACRLELALIASRPMQRSDRCLRSAAPGSS